MDQKNLNRDAFRSVRGNILFISQSSRPEIFYDVSQLCHVKYDSFKSFDVKLLNHVVKHLQDARGLKLQSRPLHSKSFKLHVFVDSE